MDSFLSADQKTSTTIMDTFLAVDPYKKMANSEKVSFDLNARCLNETPSSVIVKSHDDYNPEVSIKKTPSKEWELDVRALISSKKWLQNYGLHKNKLAMQQILPAIGFKMSEDFDSTLKRPVSSRYAEGIFNQIMRSDGKMFNITCSRDKLRQLDNRLQQAIHLYKRRLEWLTSESRRLFGVIEERAITIVLDIRNMSPQQFDMYRMGLERVLYEQVTQIAKFNLIRANNEISMYQDHCVPVTHDTVEGAVKWLWSLDRLASVSNTACVEATLRAIEDKQNEAIYLYTEGSSVDTCRQLLKEKVCAIQRKPPIHTVSYNCENSDTVRFLREFASATGGKSHVYAIIMEMDSYEGLPVDPNTNKANIMLKKKTFGGIPPGAGVREDIIQLFQEMEEARNSLIQIQKLIGTMPEPNIVLESELAPQVQVEQINEQYMSSRHWLDKYGLGPKKLELFDALGGVAFHHRDGVVDLQTHPLDEYQTDALRYKKLVNAKYCDRFPVVRWKDGKVVHVQVTPELHRTYEQKMLVALRAVQNRVDWLNQGSRALFGTLIEDQIYIVIDTSESMVPSIQYVKDKLFLLMQEQLRHKMKFNLIAFNCKAQVWQNRLVDVTETSLEGAWRWIQGLSCWGSTNTYAALQHALSDPGTQAIYLLTDGRPDQPPKSIIAQVQMQHSVPVHTISFNCNDAEANHFLYDLARATGGRYHYFSEKGADPEGQPESFESEDIRLLKDEMKKGLENLDKVAELRDECSKLSWKKEIDDMKSCSRKHPMPGKDRVSAVPAMDPQELYRSHTPTPPPPRPSSAPPDREHTPTPPIRVTTSVEQRQFTMAKRRPRSRPGSASVPTAKPLAAGHTRTSLLRTLNSQGKFDSDEWLLPETRQLFEKQASRQKRLAQAHTQGFSSKSDGEYVEAREMRALERRPRSRRFKKVWSMSSKQWLQRNGLVARKLTLLDALAPTMITHRSKYVPILDKHVLAKVFDEVLPIAHVSNRSRQSIKLINPNGVNLKAYEEKLERVLGLFNRRLDALVWDAVPKDIRDEEFVDEEGPVSFANNRAWFVRALREANWPVAEHAIIVLEDEIARGERYLQQSKDLRRAAAGGNSDDDLTVYDDKASIVSGLSARSKELSRSKESVSSSSSSGSDKSAKSKDSHSTHNSKASKGSKASEHKVGSLEVKHKPRPVRKRLEKDTSSNYTQPSEDEEKLDSEATDQERDDMVGLRVIACNKQDGLYYPGHVGHTPQSAYAIVNFNYHKRQKVRTQMIIPMSGAIPRPELAAGDFVLIRVFNQSKDSECYVPGIVEVTPEDFRHHAKFYSVLLYNGQRETTLRKFIVKIGKARFEMAIRYITHIQQQKILREEGALSNSSGLPSPQSSKRSDDEVSSVRSSQSGRGRRKKEKITKKIVKRKEEKHRKSRRKSRSRSRSQSSRSSRSKSSASSRSRSRSQSSRSQSERSRSRSGSSRSRSRSGSQSSRSKSERSQSSRSGSSRSRSSERSRSRKSRRRSVSSSRSRSRSSSSSTIRSRSSVQRSRPKSAVPQRSRSSSKSSRSRSRSRSQESKGSSTPRARSPYERPLGPTPSARPRSPSIRTESMVKSSAVTRKDIYSEHSHSSKTSKYVNVDEKDEMIHNLQYQLEKQKRKQLRQEQRLVRQARKINKIQRKLHDSDTSHDSGQSSHTVRSDRNKSHRSSSSETDTSPQRRKGSPDGTSYRDSPDLQSLRRSLPGLQTNQEVLARWQDDGWFYRGCVVAEGKDQKYIMRDSTGYMEAIMRDDILTDSEHRFDAIQPEDYVIGLHPKYVFSFAPAQVLRTYPNSSIKVEFFDGNMAELTAEDVYKISKEKYDQVVEYIKRCEKHLIGQSVAARDDITGLYKLAIVDSRVGLGQQYYIKWLDGDMTKQNGNHIFEVARRQTRHEDWSYVLAPVGQHSVTFYMPAEVIQTQPLVVQFCDGKRSSEATIDQCFWLSKEYYSNAREYLMNMKYRKLTENRYSERD